MPVLTTDADLAINTHNLAEAPEIGHALRASGFIPGANPGHWVSAGDVAVDPMVVPHQAGTASVSARAARLTPHEKSTARIARGLEPALIDNAIVTITALDPGDSRCVDLRVAGPAALLTSKAITINERLPQADNQPDRLKEKDALDAFRIFQAVETEELVTAFTRYRSDEHPHILAEEAIEVYRAHASDPGGRLTRLAASAAQGDPAVAPAFAALVTDLLAAL